MLFLLVNLKFLLLQRKLFLYRRLQVCDPFRNGLLYHIFLALHLSRSAVLVFCACKLNKISFNGSTTFCTFCRLVLTSDEFAVIYLTAYNAPLIDVHIIITILNVPAFSYTKVQYRQLTSFPTANDSHTYISRFAQICTERPRMRPNLSGISQFPVLVSR
jgi:hypothetical protein